jgi:uncharacterized protein YacL
MSRGALQARSDLSDSSGLAKRTIPEGNQVLSEMPVRAEAVWDFWILRVSLIAGLAVLGYVLSPFGLSGWQGGALGLVIALAVLLAERRLRQTPRRSFFGGALGAAAGLAAALVIALILSRTSASEGTKSFIALLSLLALGYLGLALGSSHGAEVIERREDLAPLAEMAPAAALKLLDTSVLIDGRIADICEAHFLEGVLGVPQFVLHELQLVADSADVLKRQRGRRGLQVLQRLQKMEHVTMRILEGEKAESTDVDHQLIDLAKHLKAKIVTNDFNLNKVATVQGISVLNVNQLANALKPAVLPGEPMRVLILREGKEANQGVAYLDDGTMVVVDGARRMINKTAEVIVTSVHQTTAGKMIFGRLDERSSDTASAKASASAAAAGRGDTTPND